MRKEPHYVWGMASTIGDEVLKGKQRDIEAMIARGQWPNEPIRFSDASRPATETQEAPAQGE